MGLLVYMLVNTQKHQNKTEMQTADQQNKMGDKVTNHYQSETAEVIQTTHGILICQLVSKCRKCINSQTSPLHSVTSSYSFANVCNA